MLKFCLCFVRHIFFSLHLFCVLISSRILYTNMEDMRNLSQYPLHGRLLPNFSTSVMSCRTAVALHLTHFTSYIFKLDASAVFSTLWFANWRQIRWFRTGNIHTNLSEQWTHLRLDYLQSCVPWWRQFLLQELLDLVDVDFYFSIKGHKRRVGSWCQVLQVSRLPDNTMLYDCNNWIACGTTAVMHRIVLYLLRSTVVTLKMTPLSHRIMKSLWEKGQLPMLSPSLPASTADTQTKITSIYCE